MISIAFTVGCEPVNLSDSEEYGGIVIPPPPPSEIAEVMGGENMEGEQNRSQNTSGGSLDFNPFLPRPPQQSCTLPTPPPVGDVELVAASPHNFTRPIWFGSTQSYPQLSFLAEHVFVSNTGGITRPILTRGSKSILMKDSR